MKYNNFDQTDEEPFVESSYCIVVSIEYEESKFDKYTEPKWVNFCKKHHFHPVKDAHGKIYELYLELCAEGLE